MTSRQNITTEQVRFEIEETVDNRYRVVRNWRLGVCSGFQICGTFDTRFAAEIQVAHIRIHDAW